MLLGKGVYMKMKSCKDNFKVCIARPLIIHIHCVLCIGYEKSHEAHQARAQRPVHQPEDTDQFMEPKDNVDDLMRKFEEQ